MKIIEYSSHRSKEVADLFYMSVQAIDSSIYSQAQKNAWAPAVINYAAWQKRLEHKKPYLLFIDEKLAGFMELELDGHIDCAYVSPLFQRQGVASALLKHVISVAKKQNIKQLYVEASIMAKPLFELFGFVIKHENKVVKNNVTLINYTMIKCL